MPPRDRAHDDSEAGVDPRYQNGDSNGNGANRIVWAVAGFAVVCLVTINGVAWTKLWNMSNQLTRLETQMELILTRLPP